MLSSEVLKWIPPISLLLCIPFVCYKDAVSRRVEHSFWIPLVAVNIPVALALLIEGYYEPWMYLFAFAPVIIYFALMKLHFIEGADFMFMTWISLFFMYNPISNHWFMALPFTIFLSAMFACTGIAVVTWNYIHGKGFSADIKGHVPMMIPISLALVLTVILG